MTVRKVLAIICYTVSLAAYGAAGYVSYLAWKGDISYRLGFLIFLPVWIITYWFSTFFSQLIEKRSGDKRIWLLPKKVRKLLNAFSNVLSFVLLGFWVYVYVTEFILSTR
ncbi:MAG: hypothetical protein Q4E74_06970 [Ruminococcus sp.]|nr:hypothetical protein [Ruminococcus sp.]